MRRVVILAIKPKYAEAIYAGAKCWEFRTAPPPVPGWVFLYESAPVSAVTGKVYLAARIQGHPAVVSDLVGAFDHLGLGKGLSEEELKAYVGKAESVAACFVHAPKRFDEPIPLPKGIRPPQNGAHYHVSEEKEGAL